MCVHCTDWSDMWIMIRCYCRVKCPYCPVEQSPADARQIYFWNHWTVVAIVYYKRWKLMSNWVWLNHCGRAFEFDVHCSFSVSRGRNRSIIAIDLFRYRKDSHVYFCKYVWLITIVSRINCSNCDSSTKLIEMSAGGAASGVLHADKLCFNHVIYTLLDSSLSWAV